MKIDQIAEKFPINTDVWIKEHHKMTQVKVHSYVDSMWINVYREEMSLGLPVPRTIWQVRVSCLLTPQEYNSHLCPNCSGLKSGEYLHKMRDGTLIPVSKMETKHLYNTIKLFERQAWYKDLRMPAEMHLGSAEKQKAVLDQHVGYKAMVAELEKRLSKGMVLCSDLWVIGSKKKVRIVK